ncbi:hypothetical protein C8R44DRAFT_874231 [Mycena epipterygia]|nr:hypothetical protein C8R44DRAFT_874231 [Mycena epipterygia]
MSADLQATLTNENQDNNSNHIPTLGKDSENALIVDQDGGVTRIEALYLVFSKGWKIWMLYGCLAIVSFVYALNENYAASSFESHPLIGTISVVVSIIGGVGRPFIAKIADLSSRPVAPAISVFLYSIGYIVVAASTTIGAVAGGSGIIIADITSLQWRGFMAGLFSVPFIITAFLAGDISTGISANTENGWRWGYGMFIILVPVSIGPALVVLFWADRKAKQIGALSLASSSYALRKQLAGQQTDQSLMQLGLHYWRLMDSFGLLLVGTAFTLILLPFTLYTTADNGWKNPSLIAMFVVGGILLIAFGVWEFKGASHPIMPRRVINRTLLCCIVIDFTYYLSGYVTLTYFTSYVYVVKDWSLTNYTYFTNLVLAGALQRVTHRYKHIQLVGLAIRIIGQCLIFMASNGNKSDAILVMSQVLTSLGGSFSVIGSQVATQACVPHQDMALAISLLVSAAESVAQWQQRSGTQDCQLTSTSTLDDTLNSTEIADIFGSILVARSTEPREQVIKAYDATARDLFLPALVLSCLPLVAGFLTSNFHLGTTHNAVEAG